ncbi:hypothetical protein [Novosphingobium sp. Fuku2-ISO-50]|uniref:hypothetical protein n=1 Tax=Novosphingobium sp. Fuku2-ISO-50 TaxID=1739114 RepID=UPI00076D2CBB|nr:hypothetical protein [Novosphingobium sp. Fuku2-ISO-50]KUR75222.1 hypothetical protein AQZ50_16455 [Novosphingobium sp. Fuku2-ISO-50]
MASSQLTSCPPLRVSAIVGINAAKAVIAIEVIGDWSAYDEPVLEILIRMLAPVFKKVDASADFPMEPLSAAAEEKFTTWLAEILVTNANAPGRAAQLQ